MTGSTFSSPFPFGGIFYHRNHKYITEISPLIAFKTSQTNDWICRNISTYCTTISPCWCTAIQEQSQEMSSSGCSISYLRWKKHPKNLQSRKNQGNRWKMKFFANLRNTLRGHVSNSAHPSFVLNSGHSHLIRWLIDWLIDWLYLAGNIFYSLWKIILLPPAVFALVLYQGFLLGP